MSCYDLLYWMIDRFVFVSAGDGTFHFKVLVPSVAAGAIIGKGGETIAQLQKDTGARVKMSKSHDFYPGECLIYFREIDSNAFNNCIVGICKIVPLLPIVI